MCLRSFDGNAEYNVEYFMFEMICYEIPMNICYMLMNVAGESSIQV